MVIQHFNKVCGKYCKSRGGGGGAGKRIFKEMFIVTGKDSEVLDLEAIMF